MKTNFLSLCLAISSFCSFSQSLTFNWADQFGGSGTCFSYSTVLDNSGNVYVTGSFNGTIDFDPGAGINNLTSNDNDIYIQKLDSEGNSVWVKQIGAAGSDKGYFITLDGTGNVYVTGFSQGFVDFDPGVGVYTAEAYGSDDIFALKLDNNGNFIWASTMGGVGIDTGNGLTVDASGNVFVTGEFSSIADFDPSAGTTNLYSNGNKDAFVLKLNNDGSFAWVNQIGTSLLDKGLGITVDGSNNIYVTGSFAGTADFDSGAGVNQLTTSGGTDIYVLKVDNNGAFIWVKQIGGTSGEDAYAITVDASQNVYITGAFSGTCDFDPGIGTTNLTAVGNYDVFVQKLSSVGDFVWAAQMGGASTEYGLSISLDDNGNVYTTGSFLASVDFDPGTGTSTLTSQGLNDIFIQQLDNNGDFVWVKQIGGTANDVGRTINLNSSGSIYLGGFFGSTVDFDPESGVQNLSSGSTDGFVERLDQCAPNTGTDVVVACNSYMWIDNITYTQDNNTATYTLTNNQGCDSVVTLNLTINTVNNAVTVADPMITADEAGATTYRWLDCNDNYAVIPGESGQSYTPTTNGSYAVEVTNNGCTDTSDCQLIQSLSIQANSMASFYIYPNPSNNGIWHFTTDPIELNICDLLGRNVAVKVDYNNGTIDGSNLPNGQYVVQVTTNEGSYIRKVSLWRE